MYLIKSNGKRNYRMWFWDLKLLSWRLQAHTLFPNHVTHESVLQNYNLVCMNFTKPEMLTVSLVNLRLFILIPFTLGPKPACTNLYTHYAVFFCEHELHYLCIYTRVLRLCSSLCGQFHIHTCTQAV